MFLKTKEVSKDFIGLRAVNRVDVSISKAELVGLIGPNGSGKTTLFNCITGFLKPSEGQVLWKGKDITNLAPDKIARQGITRTFQQIHVNSTSRNIFSKSGPLFTRYGEIQ